MCMIPLALFISLFELAALPLTSYAQTDIYTRDNTIKPECQSKCGRVRIPYPFGIGDGCALGRDFNVTCKVTQPTINTRIEGNVHVYGINFSDWTLITSKDAATICYDKSGPIDLSHKSMEFNLSGTPFTFSAKNKLFLIGCDDTAVIFLSNSTFTNNPSYPSNCSYDEAAEQSMSGSCSNNVGCVQDSIPSGITYYNISIRSDRNHSDVWQANPCGFSFLGQESGFTFRGKSDLNDSDFAEDARGFPVVLDWAIQNLHCSACKGNTTCNETSTGLGYTCSCKQGYRGNPYLDNIYGCQDIDECQDNPNLCYDDANCENVPGNYTCHCPQGFSGDGRINGGCIEIRPSADARWIHLFIA